MRAGVHYSLFEISDSGILLVLSDLGMACAISDQRTSNPVVALGVKHRKSNLTNRL